MLSIDADVCVISLNSHCADRVFSKKQWVGLRDKLVSWRDNMKHLLQMIESARQAQAQQLQEMLGSG